MRPRIPRGAPVHGVPLPGVPPHLGFGAARQDRPAASRNGHADRPPPAAEGRDAWPPPATRWTRLRGWLPLGRVFAPPPWGRAGWIVSGVVLALVLAAVIAGLGTRW